MKTLLTVLVAITAICFQARAQYVSIPDTNFGKWLNNNGYSACLQGNSTSGWQLDTTCNAVVSATWITCDGSNIADLTGIQYFNGLLSLSCHGNLLTTLPPLPGGVQTLYCDSNQITSLPDLSGPSLRILSCSYNQLTSLPAMNDSMYDVLCNNNLLTSIAIPPHLGQLDCSNNPLGSLPALPGSMYYLACRNNNLTVLPALPIALNVLFCGDNPLDSLPTLNPGISVLECRNSTLTFLPTLPNALSDVNCSSNQLISLPALPASLGKLNCSGNQLTSLPALPSGMQWLYCSDNQLIALPTLPNFLKTLDFANNDVTVLDPFLANIISLNCENNDLSSLPQLPNSVSVLKAAGNQLTIVPALPAVMQTLEIQNNPINCLPLLTTINSLNFTNTLVQCVPNMGNVNSSQPPLVSLPMCLPGDSCYIDSLCGSFNATLVWLSDITCNGANDGAACVQASGGMQPYTYDFGAGDTTHHCGTGFIPGAYTVFVTDNLGCRDSVNFTITDPAPLVIDSIVTKDIDCSGLPGSIAVYASGGHQPYAYPDLLYGIDSIQLNVALGANDTATITDPLPAGFAPGVMVSGTNVLAGTVITSITGNKITLSNNLASPVASAAWNFSLFPANVAVGIEMQGVYYVTVMDTAGCIAYDSVTISGANPISFSHTVNPTTCNSYDGQIVFTGFCDFCPSSTITYDLNGVSQGPVLISSPGGPEAALSGLGEGNYTNIVINYGPTGCVSYFSGTYGLSVSSAAMVDSVIVTDALCKDASNGEACVYISGVTLPLTYAWSTGSSTTNCATGLDAGTHRVTVTDGNGCTVRANVPVSEPNRLNVNIFTSTPGLLPDTLYTFTNGGTIPYSFEWSTGDLTNSAIIDTALGYGEYSVTVTDSNGCVEADTFQVGCVNNCVWPGDANSDGVADNYDILPIGIAYGDTGYARVAQDIQWYGHDVLDWMDTLASGVNKKHVDCDGNGIINDTDTLAIVQNFGLTHSKGGQRPWRMTDPALYVDLEPDTTHAGDTMYAHLQLGDMNIPVNNVYGLAFTVNYDPTVVDSTKTEAFFGSSWFGTSGEILSVAKDIKAAGQIRCGITRVDRMTRSGYGAIGRISFVITTDNINGKNPVGYYPMDVWISDLVTVDNLGTVVPVNEGSDSTEVEFVPTGVLDNPNDDAPLTLQPNPAGDAVWIKFSKAIEQGELRVIDAKGKTVVRKNIRGTGDRLALPDFINGVYFVQVTTEKSVSTKRLVVLR